MKTKVWENRLCEEKEEDGELKIEEQRYNLSHK